MAKQTIQKSKTETIKKSGTTYVTKRVPKQTSGKCPTCGKPLK